MGKTTLLANWIDRHRSRAAKDNRESLHFRFVGQSDGSSSIDRLLRSLLLELKQAEPSRDNVVTVSLKTGEVVDTEERIPEDGNGIRRAWPLALAKAGHRRRTILVLDALDQFETGLSDLTWLPDLLPANVKLIVSFKTEGKRAIDICRNYRQSGKVHLVGITPFDSIDDRRRLVRTYLSQYLKELDEQHIDELIEAPGAGNPLYLKVVLSELRIFGSFTKLGEKICRDFGETPLEAFDSVLVRLETDPAYSPLDPRHVVPLLFGLMANARNGLSVLELAEIFVNALGLDRSADLREAANDSIELFLHQVRPFLSQREGRYDFFYASFRAVATGKYLVQGADERGGASGARQAKDWHRLLADYFYGLPTWQDVPSSERVRKPGRQRKPTSRKVAELPYHLTQAADWERLEETLTDLDFVEAKCTAGLTYELVSDYERLGSIAAASGGPIVTARSCQGGLGVFCPFCISWCDVREGDLGQFIECSLCGEELKLNPFKIEMEWRPSKPRTGVSPHETRRKDASDSAAVAGFAEFVRSQAHILTRHPETTFQLAANQPPSSVMVKAAERAASSLPRPWFRWINKSWQASPDLMTLSGHSGPVLCCAFSPDGRRLVSGSDDRTLLIWDVSTGRVMAKLEGHTDQVRTCAYSTCGTLIASGGDDTTFRLWDGTTGQGFAVLGEHAGFVTCCCFLPDGRRVVSGSFDGTLRVWDLETRRALIDFTEHRSPVKACDNSPDGRRIISEAKNSNFLVWDPETGQKLFEAVGTSSSNNVSNGCAYSQDARRVISVGELIMVFEAETMKRLVHYGGGYLYQPKGKKIKEKEIPLGHLNEILACAFSPEGGEFVTASEDQTVRVWKIDTYKELAKLEGHSGSVCACAYSPDGLRIASAAEDGTVRLWDVEAAKASQGRAGHSGEVTACAYAGSTDRFFTAPKDGTTSFWRGDTGELVASLPGHRNGPHACASSPDGNRIASVSFHSRDFQGCGELKLWETDQAKETAARPVRCWGVSCSFSRCGQRIVAGWRDGLLRIWDSERGWWVAKLAGHTEPIEACVFSPDGRLLLTGSHDHTLRLWDTKHYFRTRSVLRDHTGCVEVCAFSPDGNWILSRSRDKTLWLWGPHGEVFSLRGHRLPITACAFSPDGRRAVSASYDGTVKMWNPRNREEVRTIDIHESGVKSCAYSPDGLRILTSSGDETLRVWDAGTGEQLATFVTEGAAGAFTQGRGGKSLLVGTRSGLVTLLELVGFDIGPPIVTATRYIRFGRHGWRNLLPGLRRRRLRAVFDNQLSAICEWCKKSFQPPSEVLTAIAMISNEAGVDQKDSPCLKTPDTAFEDLRLLHECQHCGQPLRFNPFWIDGL